MAEQKAFRRFAVIDKEMANERRPGFVAAYSQGPDPDNQVEIAAALAPELAERVQDGKIELFLPSLEFPSRRLDSGITPSGEDVIADLDRVVLAFAADDPEQLKDIPNLIEPLSPRLAADLPFAPADYWCAKGPPDHQFGDREAARRLIDATALADDGLTGKDVNVVIVDQGLNENELVGHFGGGWPYCPFGGPCIEPGSLKVIRGVTDNDHGMMIARNVLSVASGATLHDVPIIPGRISALQPFLSHAFSAFDRIRIDILTDAVPGAAQPWVLVNAWGVFDLLNESPPDDYAVDPTHWLHVLINQLVDIGIDVVFAAGNCGQFCPDLRCGPYDRGPGRSILGANAHPRVLSVGAVRTDGIWIGSSSQGPGPEALDLDKPDLAAPSMFTETGNRHVRNGGTSAACGMAAGVVAALRENRPPSAVSPDDLRTCLRQTAKDAGLPFNAGQRFGAGIIDAGAALAAC